MSSKPKNSLLKLIEGKQRGNFPSWLHRNLSLGSGAKETEEILKDYGLSTVCEEAKCPNRSRCWSEKTATFLILGKMCSRRCSFCDIAFAPHPPPPSEDEPQKVALSVKKLGLRHVVLTMVARDDLVDGGSGHLVNVMGKIRQENPGVTIEVLTSDFQGNRDALDLILEEAPEIFNHNIETVARLSPYVRHKATYQTSLDVLSHVAFRVKNKEIKVKTGLMVGLGEEAAEVYQTLIDLKQVGCDIVTIGQYLQASPRKRRVKEFITPHQFQKYAAFGYNLGFAYVYAAPFVRSSYNAGALLKKLAKPCSFNS